MARIPRVELEETGVSYNSQATMGMDQSCACLSLLPLSKWKIQVIILPVPYSSSAQPRIVIACQIYWMSTAYSGNGGGREYRMTKHPGLDSPPKKAHSPGTKSFGPFWEGFIGPASHGGLIRALCFFERRACSGQHTGYLLAS